MTQGITVALMGAFLLSAPAMASGSVATSTPATSSTTITATITAFNAVPGQTDDDPLITASGAYSNPEVVAARSPDLAKELPFGTIIAIEPAPTLSPACGYNWVKDRIGLRVIADTMSPKMHQKVDVLLGTSDYVKLAGEWMSSARVLGVCKDFTVHVVGQVPVSRIPKTQDALVALVSGDNTLAVNK